MKEGVKKASRNYGIGLTPLRRWIKDKIFLEEILNKKRGKNLDVAGRIPLTEYIEDHLCIKKYNFLEVQISSTEVIREAIKLDLSLKKNTYSFYIKCLYRFIYGNGFSISKITHICQSEKIDSKEYIDKFFKLL